MWTGHIGFGLVQIPVKLYKATESHDQAFHQHHGPTCMGRIGYVQTCKDCAQVVEYGDIVKGVEVGDTVVIVTDDDMAELAAEAGNQIEILEYVDAAEIDPIMYESSYYVGAPEGEKAYALLAKALGESGLVAVARFVMRGKTHLATLMARQDVLTLTTLLWPDELRAPEVPGLGGQYSAKEYAMATMVIESMVGKFDPANYTDTYQQRLRELIEAKAENEPFVAGVAHDLDATEVGDLLAKLEASVARHPAGKKRPVKKAVAKKAPAKKAPVKRTRRSVA
jgi:DNA end-binding protein Ku